MIKHLSLHALFRSVQICVIALLVSLAAAAQDKDTCAGIGWEPIYINDVNIVGTLAATQNRDCKEAARWQYSAGIKITLDKDGTYLGQIFSEEPTQISVSGNQFRWTRDVRRSAGPDKNKVYTQTWTGSLQRNRRTGSVRVYGTWSGAYAYVTDNTDFNHDFMMVIN